MKHRYVFVIVALLSCLSGAFGQKPQDTKAAVDETYPQMLAKVKGGDTSIDFKQLRIAFTKTKAYSPYDSMGDDVKAAFAALDKKDYKETVKKAEHALDAEFVDMEAQVAASLGYKGLGNEDKAEFHKNIYLGLMNSILDNGDGKTESTAYVVISTHEEYVVLRALSLTPGSQSLQHKGGHAFDVLDAIDPRSKKSIKIYFNIDISWKAETEMFK